MLKVRKVFSDGTIVNDVFSEETWDKIKDNTNGWVVVNDEGREVVSTEIDEEVKELMSSAKEMKQAEPFKIVSPPTEVAPQETHNEVLDEDLHQFSLSQLKSKDLNKEQLTELLNDDRTSVKSYAKKKLNEITE